MLSVQLASDFSAVYPSADQEFEERFPIVKTRLLELLAEKGGSVKPDHTTVELLELAASKFNYFFYGKRGI